MGSSESKPVDPHDLEALSKDTREEENMRKINMALANSMKRNRIATALIALYEQVDIALKHTEAVNNDQTDIPGQSESEKQIRAFVFFHRAMKALSNEDGVFNPISLPIVHLQLTNAIVKANADFTQAKLASTQRFMERFNKPTTS